ncbi:MAG TPA: SAM-dependent methyltransferase [Chryseolinea sp.]|nr:SAM-dependent methyltransferase [Chryseolinea sp.]HPM28733.1 SAM-dependent methyltransferase [Chryseolinea sp.]
MSNGTLYLIPTIIAEDTQTQVIPEQVKRVLPSIRYFIVEDARTARRYLSSLKIYDSIESLHIDVLDKDNTANQLKDLFTPIFDGHNLGVLSESGCPGVADPGALAARFAHDHGIIVVPLVGPSSILMALMSSGLNGQHFAFHGYLPVEAKESARVIKEFERESRLKNQTQIFIETPYRNNNIFAYLKANLGDQTLLCVASDITGSTEFIKTQSVKKWKESKVEWKKVPTVFLLLAS